MRLQITLFDKEKRYKPISTTVEVESMDYYNTHKRAVLNKAMYNICAKRGVDKSWLKEYGYTQFSTRIYNPTLIQAHNRAKYKQIKKERGWE